MDRLLIAGLFFVLFSSEIRAQTDTTIIIQENDTGVVSYDGSIDSSYSGYTGAGYINTENSAGKGITWEVCAPDTGEYLLEWRFANGLPGNRTARVLVNGEEAVNQVDFPSTGLWSIWDTTSVAMVTLQNGPNRINLASTYIEGLANIDYIAVTGFDPKAGFCAVSVSGVSISPKEISLGVKGIKQLEAIVSPANASNRNVSWNSSDSTVAIVNDSGLVSGVKEGSARIMVTTEDGSFTDTSLVDVITVPVYYLETSVNGEGSVTPSSDSIADGSVICLTAIPAEGWRFTGWSGDTSGMENPLYITMDTSKTINANFTEIWAHIIGFGDQTVDGYAGYKGTTGGGTATPVIVTTPTEFRVAVAGNDSEVILVKGRLNVGNISIGSNKTIAGYDENAGLYGGTIRLQGSNYIIQNLNIGPGNEDVMELSGATRVYITKCSMHDAGDEILSIVRESDYVTVSWCKFYFNNTHSHAFAHLIGNSDDRETDRGKLHVTMHHNWYAQGIRGRQPRVRYGHVHIYNNYYNSVGSGYCIGVGYECHIRLENTVFQSVSNPWADYGGASNGEMGWHGLRFISSPIPTFVKNSFPVFNLPYDYAADPHGSVKQRVMAGAGNVFGIADTTETIQVAVTAPSDQEEFEINETIALEAEVSVASGRVDSIQFYRNNTLIGVSRTLPYTLNWENVTQGKYKITAKAFTNDGKSTFSDFVTITVHAEVGTVDQESDSFIIFPNPAKNQISIRLDNDFPAVVYYTLYDSRGHPLLEETFKGREHSMDLSSLPAGIYILYISSEKGHLLRKVIKE